MKMQSYEEKNRNWVGTSDFAQGMQYTVRFSTAVAAREIPRPAGENPELRDDAADEGPKKTQDERDAPLAV
jgi:hypothetical protein